MYPGNRGFRTFNPSFSRMAIQITPSKRLVSTTLIYHRTNLLHEAFDDLTDLLRDPGACD